MKSLRLLIAALAFTTVQGVMAQTTCKGTVYFGAPSTWTGAWIGGFNVTTLKEMALNTDGYYEYDLANLGVQGRLFFALGNQATAAGSKIVTAKGFDVSPLNGASDAYWPTNEADIPCPGEGNRVYVTEDPVNPGKTLITENPPDAKYFYVLVPEEKEWQFDDMMIHFTDSKGGKKDTILAPVKDLCGWVGMAFSQPPSDVYMYLKNSPDMQLGMNGLWDVNDLADPIDLNLLYETYGTDKLYFIPDDSDWPVEGSAGWFVTDPGIPEAGDNSRCTFSLASVIYDTDMLVNAAFSDAVGADKGHAPAGVENCVGVQHGLVLEDLGPDNKPVFSGTATADACFGGSGAATNFKALFNYVSGMNEVQCYDIPFRHYGNDSRWSFLSDSVVTNGLVGGFFPLENSTDAGVVTLNVNGVPTLAGPLPGARTAREASGPIPNHAKEALGVELDYYCKTPGWPTGKECQGLFADGSEFTSPDLWCWGDYCEAGFRRWGLDGDIAKTEKRNQHFCMQSHATFTYNENQEFTVIGDDDIWVFINRKLAIDNGGAHLPAPGHVMLRNLNTAYGEGFLVPGQDYPIDIFVCDRRTPMSNLNIKTNIYLKQTTGIDLATSRNSAGGLVMDFCVENSGGGDCAAVALGDNEIKCGEDISSTINYSITTRKGDIPTGCPDCSALALGQISHSGIDLTNPKVPVIYPDRISGLAPGSYRLNIEVNGKKSYFPFIVKGGVGIVSQDVVFENIDNEVSAYPSGTQWKFASSGMAGTRVPIYISSPDDIGGVDLLTASGQSYTLSLSAGATLYRTNDPADMTPVVTPYAGVVNETGIDTLWVEVPLAGIASSSQTVTATVGNTSATITFYAPVLTFAEPATKDSEGNVLTWNPVLKDPDYKEDGSSEYYHWVGADVDLYVVVVNPATGDLCRECNFPIDFLDASNGIVGDVSQFDDGVALVRIRSNSEYVDEAASVTVGSIENNTITAPYGNMRFYTPTSPIPVVVDIFDVKGKPLGQMNIPSEFYSETADYLDGRADSLAIIYDRKIHEDSIPTFICLNFDEKNLKKINPYEMGISNNSKDKEMYCSTQFDADDVKKAYERSPDGGRTLVFSVDEPFSAGVKTSVNPDNKIVSFTEYAWKGKVVRTFYEKSLTDRMAPIILSAHASTETDGGSFSQLTIVTSEPVWVRENVESVWNMGDSESVWAKGDVDSTFANTAFSFYLNSATQLPGAERYRHVKSLNRPGNGKDTLVLRYDLTDDENPPPHVGDYIRFRSDTYMWADATNGYAPGCDTLRPASDADMFWNFPTNYNSIDRLPSPWVQIKGDSEKVNPDNPDVEFAKPSFRIKMTGPFQFTIVMDEEISSKASKFTVMDLQGRVVRQGVIAAKETAVPLLSKGSYVVKVGLGYRRVNVR